MSNSSQPSDFLNVAKAIAKANGISEQQAEDYVAAVGEKPETDPDGKVIVRDQNGKEVTRLIYPTAGA